MVERQKQHGYGEKLKELKEELKPTREVKRAYDEALEDYLTYKNFGERYPQGGGHDDQPAEWVEYIQAFKTADDRATSLIKLEMEEEERKKQAEAERKAKAKRR